MIYVISLKTVTDRRESIQQQFNEIDMDFEFFDGRKGEHPLFDNYYWLNISITVLKIFLNNCL